jgi:hypothetical protein
MRGVDARVEARDDKQGQARKETGALLAASGSEGSVASKGGFDAGKAPPRYR